MHTNLANADEPRAIHHCHYSSPHLHPSSDAGQLSTPNPHLFFFPSVRPFNSLPSLHSQSVFLIFVSLSPVTTMYLLVTRAFCDLKHTSHWKLAMNREEQNNIIIYKIDKNRQSTMQWSITCFCMCMAVAGVI